jgi:hypothetical protein
MEQYILNLLPRLWFHGRMLNSIEELVDKVWIKYTDQETETYRFKRDKTLFINRGGNVIRSQWDLLNPNGLYIGNNETGTMYRHSLINEAILMLKIERVDKVMETFLFFNEKFLSNANVIQYINEILNPSNPRSEENRLNERRLFNTNKGFLYVYYTNGTMIGGEAFDDYVRIESDYFEILNDENYISITIVNGRVTEYTMR